MDLTAVIEQTAQNLWAASSRTEPEPTPWDNLSPIARALCREHALALVSASARPLMDAMSAALLAQVASSEFCTVAELTAALETLSAALPAPATIS